MTILTEGRAAFLAERRTGIGGSDIAALDGCSPYASVWSVWAAKVGLAGDDEPTTAMQLGTDLEPIIAEMFHRRTGLYAAEPQRLVRHPEAPHRYAHLDGLVFEGYEHDYADEIESALPGGLADALGVFEAKSSAEAWTEVPRHYRAQVLWQLHVTGLDHGWVAALQFPFGRARFDIFEIDADLAEQARLAELADRFWHDHVLTGTAPPADEHTATTDAIKAAWGALETAPLPTVDFTDELELLTELCDLKRKAAALKPLIARRENRVKAIFGFAAGDLEPVPSEGTIAGEARSVVSWRAQTEHRLDTDAVRRDHGTRYDRTITKRVLRLHGRFQP